MKYTEKKQCELCQRRKYNNSYVSISGGLAGTGKQHPSLSIPVTSQPSETSWLYPLARKPASGHAQTGDIPVGKEKCLHAKTLSTDDSSGRRHSGGCGGCPTPLYHWIGAVFVPINRYLGWVFCINLSVHIRLDVMAKWSVAAWKT